MYIHRMYKIHVSDSVTVQPRYSDPATLGPTKVTGLVSS